MFGLSKTFQLDPRLEAETLYILTAHDSTQIRLMNDARWPWLIVVPVVVDAEEVGDLSIPRQELLMREAVLAGEAVRKIVPCDKLNIGALGNIVRQLHLHVIARSEDDPNWPGPVWGYGERAPYDRSKADDFIAKFKEAFHVPILG